MLPLSYSQGSRGGLNEDGWFHLCDSIMTGRLVRIPCSTPPSRAWQASCRGCLSNPSCSSLVTSVPSVAQPPDQPVCLVVSTEACVLEGQMQPPSLKSC